jgi:DNA-directed RNA polymerase alpha subunit
MKIDPTRDLPDVTPIKDVRLPTRILNALSYVGLQTVGEIRETSDANLRSIPKVGSTTVRWLRDNL